MIMIYKIKFLIALIVLCFVSQRLEAQDVIVKKDGTTILSKVLEVNEANLKYKKFKNPQGPTYSISLSEIMSVNYDNDEEDDEPNRGKRLTFESLFKEE